MELYVKNKTKVKININKESVKMGKLIGRDDKLRKFLYFAISLSVSAVVLVPIAIGVGVWIAHQ